MPTLLPFEKQIIEAEELDIEVHELEFKSNIRGLYIDKVIAIDKHLTWVEKNCVLAEEIGHALLNYGDIIDQSILSNRKQKRRGRIYAYRRLVSLHDLIRAYEYGCNSIFEAAEYLDVTVEFFKEAISYYLSHYGTKIVFEGYEIHLNEHGVYITKGV